jgi:hypothetical protein
MGAGLSAAARESIMMQYLIAETRDCSPIQSRRIFAAYEEAWGALQSSLGSRDGASDRARLGKRLLDAIIDEIDACESQEAVVDASLARLGFYRDRMARRAEAH